jgi:hypothetical protein
MNDIKRYVENWKPSNILYTKNVEIVIEHSKIYVSGIIDSITIKKIVETELSKFIDLANDYNNFLSQMKEKLITLYKLKKSSKMPFYLTSYQKMIRMGNIELNAEPIQTLFLSIKDNLLLENIIYKENDSSILPLQIKV